MKIYKNPSMNTIYLTVFVYKPCQYYHVTEWFIGGLMSSFEVKSWWDKELFPVCAQIGWTVLEEAMPRHRESFFESLVWEWLVLQTKERKQEKTIG